MSPRRADSDSENSTGHILGQLFLRNCLVVGLLLLNHVPPKRTWSSLPSYACPPMLLRLDLRTAFVYGAFSVPICVSLWIYLPETKG